MKMKFFLVCSVMLIFLSTNSLALAAKATISIPPLENKANISKEVADSFVDMLTTAFAKTRKFNVLERASLSKVADEQMFGASGAVDPKTAAKIGKLVGSQFILIGSITTFGTQKKKTGAFGVELSSSESKIGVDIRLVDSTTGQIMMAESYSKSASDMGITATVSSVKHQSTLKQGPLAELARAVSDDIAKESMFAVYPPKVIQVKADSIATNYGDGILTVGELYDIYSLGESLIDPDTGENLGADEEFVGTVKVSRTTAKMSYADIIDNGTGIQKGMVLRPKPVKEESQSIVKVPW